VNVRNNKLLLQYAIRYVIISNIDDKIIYSIIITLQAANTDTNKACTLQKTYATRHPCSSC